MTSDTEDAAKGNARSSGYEREPDDFYTEPSWCTELLLLVEPFTCEIADRGDGRPYAGRHSIWDPAAGTGAVVRGANLCGYAAVGTDLRGRRQGVDPKLVSWTPFDFLSPPQSLGGRWRRFEDIDSAEFDPRPGSTAIICNPPFNLAVEFIRVAITLVEKCAFLLPVTFLGSQARDAMFLNTQLSRIVFLSRRPSMPPGRMLLDGTAKPKNGATDFAWLVWTRGHKGEPTCTWVA